MNEPKEVIVNRNFEGTGQRSTHSDRKIDSEAQRAQISSREGEPLFRDEVLDVVYRSDQYREPDSNHQS
jgi:hypothetical protein